MASRVLILLTALLAFNAAWAKLDVLIDSPKMSAKPGDKVVMKCALQNFAKPLILKDFMVQWYTRGKLVTEFDEKITVQTEGMSLCLDSLKNGDATLTIDSFTSKHAGNYRCYLYYKADSSIKEIVLADTSKPTEEPDVPLSTCETVLDKKLDNAIKMLENVNTKLDELKKCPK